MIFDETQLLKKELTLLEKATVTLKHSYENCKMIEHQKTHSLTELDMF